MIYGHHRGLSSLFFTEMWERFSFFGMRALLLLYLTAPQAQGGLGMSPVTGGAIYGLFTAGAYLFSLPGGWIADRVLGLRRAVFWGGVLISCGNFMIAFPATIELFYIGLLIIAVGTGLLKPNVSCLVGELYKDDTNSRRDSAFSIYYLGINLGAVLAPFVAGTIGETIAYRWGFCCAGVGMLLGLVQYRITSVHLGTVGIEVQSTQRQWRRAAALLLVSITSLIAAIAMLASGVIRIDVQDLARFAGVLMLAITVLFFGSIGFFGRLSGTEKKRVAAIAVFFLGAALFWAGYEQAGSSLNLFTRDYTDRSFLGRYFTSSQHPVTWYQSLQSIFVLMFAPIFAWVWVRLGRRSIDPSAPVKFGLGLFQLGVSFLVMMVASSLVATTGFKALPGWIILTYLLQTTGELCLSPIGLSNVSKLAPSGYVGQMMGIWFLGVAVGDLMAGLIGGKLGAESVAEMPPQFLIMALVACIGGVLMMLASRRVRTWMN